MHNGHERNYCLLLIYRRQPCARPSAQTKILTRNDNKQRTTVFAVTQAVNLFLFQEIVNGIVVYFVLHSPAMDIAHICALTFDSNVLPKTTAYRTGEKS